MKACSRCLRWLPSSSFAKNRAHLAAQCNDCTNQRDRAPEWRTNPKPLASAISKWRHPQ